MKKILKIKSVIDVITNSSSEVFIAKGDGFDRMDWEWLRSEEGRGLFGIVAEVAKLPMEDKMVKDATDGWPSEEEFDKIAEKYRDLIQKNIVDENLYWSEVEENEYGEFDAYFNNVIWHEVWK